MARLARSPLGRETQTAALETLLASAMVGEGRAAFVVGEAGLGKTTMLEHASVMARGLGMRTLHGAAQELERQRPFAAISACLGVGEALADIFGARAAEVLRGDAQHTAPGVNLGLGGVDFAAVEMMLGLVDDLCAQGPLAVIIDDIQWADDASLQVLNGLVKSVHQLPLLVVCAYQPAPRSKEIERLAHSLASGTALLELAPLAAPKVIVLLKHLCGAEPGPHLRRMVEGAAGNPLYIKELVNALALEGAIEVHDGIADVTADCPIPPLTALITNGLRHLPDGVLQVLRTASVLGDGFTALDLAAVLEVPTHQLLSLITEAEVAGVLRSRGDRLHFRHDLVRRTLYDTLSGSVRGMLHVKTAQALAGAGVVPERVAGHLCQAAPDAGYFLIAWLAESAVHLTTRAPALALELLDKALTLADPGSEHYSTFQLHRAIAQLACGHLANAEESARCALARTTRGPGSEVVLRWIVVEAAFARGRADLALKEARSAYGNVSVPEAEAVGFHAFSSVCLFALGRLSEAEEVAVTARHAAQTHADSRALAYALHTLAVSRFLKSPDTEAVELARQASRIAQEALHPAQRHGFQLTLANCYIELGRYHEAEAALAAVREATQRTGGVFLPWYHLSCALLAFNTGRWDDALADIEAGLETAEPFGLKRALRALGTLIDVHRGTPPTEVRSVDAEKTSDDGWVASFYEYLPWCASALVDEAQNNHERSYARLVDAFDGGVGHLAGSAVLGFLAPDLVRLAMARGDMTDAQRFASAAQKRADSSGARYHLGDALRCQGMLAQDPDLLLRAARCYHDAPHPMNEAHAYTDAAELLVRRGRPDEACPLLDRALEIYTWLSATWDAARTTARLRGVAMRRHKRRPRNLVRHGWDALTPTEHIVAEHIAEGCYNAEIATRMSISRRTVSTHVSSILKKLDMTSRVELAGEVIRRQHLDRSRPKD
ncbi:AAA family ATPase [Streptomyces lydicamycinicus]|uniref:helix-turn-helix transcriptional regulator n=1 Tax=Streptomyces lydicamycinicus TaxID=1546107 RepID=UPI002034CC5A|nr:AAA family ATPase [Streptomyces lydicamycinicus]USA00523.1 AAA family ATPase [Streptomyces lydicamycinicus]